MTNPIESETNDPTARPPGAETTPFGRTQKTPADPLEEAQRALEKARAWVRQNETMAMMGAFAVGTFIGVMMRD